MNPEQIESIAENTDRELWRSKAGDYYSPSIHVTAQGSIGINVGGKVFVMSVEKWHELAESHKAELEAVKAERQMLMDALAKQNKLRQTDLKSAVKCGEALGLSDDDNRTLIQAARDLRAELAARDAEIERLNRMPRIYTRCPACSNDTLTINDDKHLLCTWLSCPDPTLIDRIGEIFPHKWEQSQQQLAETKAKLQHEREVNYAFDLHASEARNVSLKNQLEETKSKLAEVEKSLIPYVQQINLVTRDLLAQEDLNAKLREALTKRRAFLSLVWQEKALPGELYYKWREARAETEAALALPFDQTLLERICDALAYANDLAKKIAADGRGHVRFETLLAELRPETK